MLSVIVPVLNEAGTIGPCLDRLAQLSPPPEVIVCDGGSTDSTLEEVASRPWVELVRTPRAGRGLQMNAGAAAAKRATLLFLHADSWLPEDASEQILSALEDPRIAGGGFHKQHDAAPRALKAMDWWLNHVRTDLFHKLVGTNAIFVRAEVFRRLGGYRDWPLLEDVDFSDRLQAMGRLAVLRGPVLVSARKYLEGGVVRRTAVNALVMFGHRVLRLKPEVLASVYGRKSASSAVSGLFQFSSLGRSIGRMKRRWMALAVVAALFAAWLLLLRETPMVHDHDLGFELAAGSLSGLDWDGTSLVPTGHVPGVFVSAETACPRLVREVVCWWNVDTTAGALTRVEARLRRNGAWSRWFLLAAHPGQIAEVPVPNPADPRDEKDARHGVALDIDTLRAEPPGASHVQLRVVLDPARSATRPRFFGAGAVVTSEPTDGSATRAASETRVPAVPGTTSPATPGRAASETIPPTDGHASAGRDLRPLAVPFRYQRWEDEALRSRICCPTSLAMAMEYYGVKRPTREVAMQCYDPAHDVFGNWSFAAAAAAEYGMKARVTRLRGWARVRSLLVRGRPVIISVRFGPGELAGSPLVNGTKGH
ncbi:MAG: TIGR04283 family arsenosugar biosynthesis glycosyltransferase, partial [candidate division NC10 bacterium]|nr:TIGR04283 family arsenosugar biosynthesis glycosyltransferase [candidate division NC10 bacterium]